MTTLFPVTRMLDAAFTGSPDTWRTSDRVSHLVPRADVFEGETEFLIVMDLPGVKAGDLEINLENQALTVKAAKESLVPEGYALRRNERAGKVNFSRTFTLGNVVDSDNISARLEEGVLHISLPKSEVSLPRRIEVK